jgi:hypothetical protein
MVKVCKDVQTTNKNALIVGTSGDEWILGLPKRAF